MPLERILLVDDEDDIRTIGEMALSAVGGYTVLLAANGAEAVERAARDRPDLIILDVMMPGLDGPSTLARLRAAPGSERTPVIFMTAKVQKDEIARYLALGAIGVIRKPFDPMALHAEVAALYEAGAAR